MASKIFVGNLAGNTRSEDVRVLFEKYGQVTECDVLKNYGFVHMADKSEAETAIQELDGYSVKGSRMRVEMSTGKSSRGGGRGGGRSRGGRGGRGGGGGDRYGGPSRYDQYSRRQAPYDYYDRPPYPRDRPPLRGDDRRMAEDRYMRDRYDPYDRRPPSSDPYFDRYQRAREDAYRRPPPDYYNRQRFDPYDDPYLDHPDPRYPPYDDPYYPEHRYPDERGEAGLQPTAPAPLAARPPAPAPARPAASAGYFENNGYDDYNQAAEPTSQTTASAAQQNYYDRFYKTPPTRSAGAQRPVHHQAPSARGGMVPGYSKPQINSSSGDHQAFLQTEPIYF